MRNCIVLILLLLFVNTASSQDSIATNTHSPVPQFTGVYPTIYCIDTPINRVAELVPQQSAKQYLFWILLIIGAFIVLLWNIARPYSKNLLKSFLNINHASQMARSERSNDKVYSWLYLLLSIVVLSIALYFALPLVLGFQFAWVVLFLVLLGLLLFDILLNWLSGIVLDKGSLAKSVNYYNMAWACFVLFVFFPIICLLVFSPNMLFKYLAALALGIGLLAFIFKELRFVQLVFQERMVGQKFYFFLYICTFKFLPILLFAKVFFKLTQVS